MPAVGRNAVLPALLVATVATFAGAQQKACEIDENTPNQVARAVLQLQLASSASKPEDVASKLREAVKLVADLDKSRNPVGRSWVLGRALVLWMAQPNIGPTPKRGTLGYTTNPDAPIDLVAAIDSAFTVIETQNPECVATTAGWRQQKGWVEMINSAIEMANSPDSAKVDSSVVLARRSLELFRGAPYGYMVLAQASAKRSHIKEAIGYYKQAVDAAKDTTFADVRRQMLLTLGSMAADAAEQASGADKTAYLKESKDAFDALAKDPGTKYADYARSGQARVALITGDTASLKGSYAEQLANPSAYSYNSLMQAAVSAARASQNADAIKLFEAAYKVNPYHRDVLYNLARLYMLGAEYAKGMPVVKQLIAVDPANPDNYQLYAIGWAAFQKDYIAKQKHYDSTAKVYGNKANTAKGATVQKAYIDSAAKVNSVIKAYADSAAKAVDSALKYNDLMQKLPVKIVFTEFTASDTKTNLAGTLTNSGAADKSYTLKIEFLDKSGSVVATADVPVGPVKAGASAQFSAVGNAPGIVAFRYAPLQ